MDTKIIAFILILFCLVMHGSDSNKEKVEQKNWEQVDNFYRKLLKIIEKDEFFKIVDSFRLESEEIELNLQKKIRVQKKVHLLCLFREDIHDKKRYKKWIGWMNERRERELEKASIVSEHGDDWSYQNEILGNGFYEFFETPENQICQFESEELAIRVYNTGEEERFFGNLMYCMNQDQRSIEKERKS